MTPLAVQGLVAGYRPDLPIVHGVALSVAAGEVVALLGPNGAGKSTLIKAIAGLVHVMAGRIGLMGEEMVGMPAHRIAASGIGYVPQSQNVFMSLTVDDNLRAGSYHLGKLARGRIEEAYRQFPDLATRRRALGGHLSGGQRQMLAIARTLLSRPRVLLLDEPSAGLAPKIAAEVFGEVRRIAARGIAVLMVEQNVKAGLAAADRGMVMVEGMVAMEGAAAELARDSQLRHVFLGGRGKAA